METGVEVCNDDTIELRFQRVNSLWQKDILLDLNDAITLRKQLDDAIFICQNYPLDDGGH